MDRVPRRERLKPREYAPAAISPRARQIPMALPFCSTGFRQTEGKDADEPLGTDVGFVGFDPLGEQSLPNHITVGSLRTLTYSNRDINQRRSDRSSSDWLYGWSRAIEVETRKRIETVGEKEGPVTAPGYYLELKVKSGNVVPFEG